MSLEDDARRCCEDIDDVRRDADRVNRRGGEETKKNLAQFQVKLGHFVKEAREAQEKLGKGVREGLDGLVTAWREARGRLQAHLCLIEAKGIIESARRLTADQYFVAAEAELSSALRRVMEARRLLGEKDASVTDLLKEIEGAVTETRAKASTAAARLEKAAAHNDRLLAHFE
jgi:hypothetical protein